MNQIYQYNEKVRFYNRSRRKLSRLLELGKNERKQGILKKRIERLFDILSRMVQALKIGTAALAMTAGMVLFQPDAAQAQPFAPVEVNPFGLTDIGSYSSIDLADLDGDGDLDMIRNGYYDGLVYFENTGTTSSPSFVNQGNVFGITPYTSSEAITLSDLDSDGDFEMILADGWAGTSIRVYENNGDPAGLTTFSPTTSIPEPHGSYGYYLRAFVDFADLDVDGDLDMITTDSWYSDWHYYENNGDDMNPSFPGIGSISPYGISPYSAYYIRGITFGDVDGDGDVDLLVGEYNGQLSYYENTASPGNPAFFNPTTLDGLDPLPAGADTAYPSLVDLDGDGDLDVLSGAGDGNFYYYENLRIDDGTPMAPVNDEIAGASEIACNEPSLVVSTSNATDLDQPACLETGGGSGLWYTFVGTGDLTTISTCGSGSVNTELALLSGPPEAESIDELECVAYNDDNPSLCTTGDIAPSNSLRGGTRPPGGSVIRRCTVADLNYYIYVDSGDHSPFELSMTCETCPPPPTLECTGNLTPNNDPGQCGAFVTFEPPAVSGGTGLVSVSCEPMNSSFFPVGETTVTCTATDELGQEATCNFTVTVLDAEPPTINCHPMDYIHASAERGIGEEPDYYALGECGAYVEIPIPYYSDNCCDDEEPPLASGLDCESAVDISLEVPGIFNTGDFTGEEQPACAGGYSKYFVFTAPAFEGGILQVTSCGYTDDSTPLALYSGSCETGLDVILCTSENCKRGDRSGGGPTEAFYEMSAGETVYIVWSDSYGATAHNFFVEFYYGIEVSEGEAMRMGDEPQVGCTLTNTFNGEEDASGFYPLGTTTVTFTVTDAAGLTAECTIDVVVEAVGVEAPVIACPDDITVESGDSTEPMESETGPGTGTATALDNFDPEPLVTHNDVVEEGDCDQESVITRVWKAEDSCGNTTYCLQTITIEDTTAPEIFCPNDTIVSCNTTLDPMDLGLEATATDAADPDAQITYLDVSDQTSDGSCSDFNYELVRIWYATDACGNSSFCKQTIMVVDTVAPSITCPETLNVEPSEGLPEPDFAGGSTSDNCGGAVTVTFVSDVSDGLSEPETVTRTYRATDPCGNTAECSHLIIIDDTVPPEVSCPGPVTVSCIEDVPTPDVDAVQTDSDCGATVTHVGDVSDGNSCPETITRTYLATDDCDNSVTCEQTITVHDLTPPTISCPGAVAVSCSQDIPAPDFEGGSTDDNCALGAAVSHVSDVSDGNLNPEVITRTYRASDECGNTVECTQQITILDTEAPTFDCPADEVVSNDPGECGAFVEIAIPEVLDNCCSLEEAPEGIAPPDDDADLKAAQAANEARVAAMRAASVSSGTAERMIFTDEMIDKIGTSKTSMNTASMKLGGGCPNPISDPSFEAGAFGGIWTEFSTNFGTVLCDPIGCGPALALTGDWYAWFGGAGAIFEEGSVSQVVAIPADALTLDVPMATGFIGSTTDFFEVLIDGTAVLTVLGSEGVGGYVLYSIDITAYAGGTHTIDFHAITNEGESFIMDDVDIICPGSQACTLTLTNDHTGTDDASGFYPVGETTVTYTAQESNGNSTVCSFTVTVNDTEGLVIVCPEPISVVADPGACTAVVTYDAPVGTENCEGTSTQQIEGRTSGDEFEVGVTLNTYLVIDANGNTALCDFTVTVLEDEPPTFGEYDDYYEVPFDADLCGAEVALETPPAFDNCGPVTVVNDYNGSSNGLDVYPAGEETMVTWTATDASGNTSTTTTTVKVGKLKAASNLRVVCREGQGTFKLKWDLAPGAQRYRAQVRNLLGTIVLDKQMWNPGANAFGPLPNDTVPAGNYQWRVISYCKMDDAPNLPGWQEYAKRFTSWQPITLPCTNQAALPFDDSSQSIKLLDDGVEADVYPNPTEGIFYLDTDMEDYTLEVYDLKGQQVYMETRMKTGITELNLQEAPNGMYLLKMYNNSAIKTKRITIQR